MRFSGATGRIRTSGLPGRRTTTRRYRPALKREFCRFYPTAPKTRKSPLLVVTTGSFSILRCSCTVVVKWWSRKGRRCFAIHQPEQSLHHLHWFRSDRYEQDRLRIAEHGRRHFGAEHPRCSTPPPQARLACRRPHSRPLHR